MTDFSGEAFRLASHIASQARSRRQGPGLTWSIRRPDRQAGHGSMEADADPTFYQGVAGIVFFLHQASRRCEDPGLRKSLSRAVDGGMAHLLDAGPQMSPSSWGFHGGRLGVAWTVAQIADQLGHEEHLQAALDMIFGMSGYESQDHGLDVIGGAAGAVPALLHLGHLDGVAGRGGPEPERLRAMARKLADRLLETVHQEPDGWSWATIPRSAYRNVTGYAHGTAGIAVALLEIAAAFSDGRARFAADMAFLYEDSLFDETAANWPDLRNVPYGEMLRALPNAELRRLAAENRLPPYRRAFMSAWCHGAPGIALARLRAFELTGEPHHLETARAALGTTATSVESAALASGNFSLCHGAAGNADVLLDAARHLDEPAWEKAARRAASWGLERFAGASNPSWPCGTMDAATDPSLLLGEAGIGLFLLRIDDPTVPSGLLLRPQALPLKKAEPDRPYREAARASAEHFFAHAMKSARQLGIEAPTQDPPLPKSPAATTFHALQGAAAEEPRLAAAFALEKRLFEKVRELEDFSAESRLELLRVSWEELEIDSCRWRRPADAELIFCPPPDDPDADAVPFFLRRRTQRFEARRLPPLAAVILESLDEPTPTRTIRRRVADALDGQVAPERLAAVVHAQLEQLYRAEFLTAIPSDE